MQISIACCLSGSKPTYVFPQLSEAFDFPYKDFTSQSPKTGLQ